MTTDTKPPRSPSGLFRRAAWEAEVYATYERLPKWWASDSERDRQFLRWVAAEARSLAIRLARLIEADTPADVAGSAQALAVHLAEDIAWAERLLGEGKPSAGIHRAA
ncbi:MAG TPA: hypothetical protein VEB64_01800 [Azospirillaceae bacterium]|nr:hypothetical protein [Azospirillaceae bacterium]